MRSGNLGIQFSLRVLAKGLGVSTESCVVVHADNNRRTYVRPADFPHKRYKYLYFIG